MTFTVISEISFKELLIKLCQNTAGLRFCGIQTVFATIVETTQLSQFKNFQLSELRMIVYIYIIICSHFIAYFAVHGIKFFNSVRNWK